MARPVVTETSELGARGVRIVDAVVHEELCWLFRPRERRDLGIDGEIELVDNQDEKRRGTGRLIAVQIKCGESFFSEEDEDAYVFRGDPKHLEYWADFSLPVLIVICHPVTRAAYWVEFDPGVVVRLKKGWKILIPKRNRLENSIWELDRIARRNRMDDVIDLSIQAWLHTRHTERVEFCGIFALPRDFGWFQHLLDIGEETVMLHWLYARYGHFEITELKKVLQHLPENQVYAKTLHLCLVAETPDAFALGDEWKAVLDTQPDVRVSRLLFDRSWPRVGELGSDGLVTLEYDRGEPLYRQSPNGDWV